MCFSGLKGFDVDLKGFELSKHSSRDDLVEGVQEMFL
jgi:hypothetical protein